jgi:exodeoxyribonuclease VII small subunit
LPLDEALKAFERGVALTRECQSALAAAQSRVDILLQREGAETLAPFATDADEADETEAED